MSTITSPRRSESVQTPTSSRSSISLDRPTTGGPRRNRAALRDYYGLKVAAPADGTVSNSDEHIPLSELDKPDFDAPTYVKQLLARDGLEGILRVETGLVGEIRGLDGERKALVYDNYSKLIDATDTIRRMRTSMDPLAPMTTTLEPAMGHIAQTAKDLRDNLRSKNQTTAQSHSSSNADKKVETVRWVLDTPRRLEDLVREGKTEAAEADWTDVQSILDTWKGVEGVEDLRARAEAAMAS